MNRSITSRTLLEAVAKVVLFAQENNTALVKKAEFVGGVYKIELEGFGK